MVQSQYVQVEDQEHLFSAGSDNSLPSILLTWPSLWTSTALLFSAGPLLAARPQEHLSSQLSTPPGSHPGLLNIQSRGQHIYSWCDPGSDNDAYIFILLALRTTHIYHKDTAFFLAASFLGLKSSPWTQAMTSPDFPNGLLPASLDGVPPVEAHGGVGKSFESQTHHKSWHFEPVTYAIGQVLPTFVQWIYL